MYFNVVLQTQNIREVVPFLISYHICVCMCVCVWGVKNKDQQLEEGERVEYRVGRAFVLFTKGIKVVGTVNSMQNYSSVDTTAMTYIHHLCTYM